MDKSIGEKKEGSTGWPDAFTLDAVPCKKTVGVLRRVREA